MVLKFRVLTHLYLKACYELLLLCKLKCPPLPKMTTAVSMVTYPTFRLKYLIILYKIVRATNTLFDVMEAKKINKI